MYFVWIKLALSDHFFKISPFLKYDKNLGKWLFDPAARESLADVNASPLAAPNVEHATPTGTSQAIEPKTFEPKVIATALIFFSESV